MALIIKHRVPGAPLAPVVQLIATAVPIQPRKGIVLHFGGKQIAKLAIIPPTEQDLSERQKKALVESGLMEPEEKKYEDMFIGERVTITNSMFPWVKHYKPGDHGVITMILNNRDPMGKVDGAHNMHVILIDQPKEASRRGQTAALFRWEFEKAQNPRIEAKAA